MTPRPWGSSNQEAFWTGAFAGAVKIALGAVAVIAVAHGIIWLCQSQAQ